MCTEAHISRWLCTRWAVASEADLLPSGETRNATTKKAKMQQKAPQSRSQKLHMQPQSRMQSPQVHPQSRTQAIQMEMTMSVVTCVGILPLVGRQSD